MEMFENTQVLQGSLSKYKAMSVLYSHDFYNNMEQSYIEGQTIQWPNEKDQEAMTYKTQNRN
jgi:hypothetical protein